MSKPRSGTLRLLLVVPLGLLILSCGTDATSLSEPDRSSDQAAATTSTTDLELATATPEQADAPAGASTDRDAESSAVIGVPAEALPPDGEAASVEGIVAGTDSSTPAEVAGPDGVLRTRLVDFATLYLSFDYRIDHTERVDGFRPLVTTGLLEQLATPIPSTLSEGFEAEQRVVEATVLDLTAVDDGVYALTTTVMVTTNSREPDDDVRVLVLVVDEEQLVSDVR